MLALGRDRHLGDAHLDKVHPEGNLPRKACYHKGSEQRPHVWRQDDKHGPDVDLAGALVEEEHVKDEHEPSALGDGAEEAVEDAGGHEGLECRGGGAPCSCCGGEDEKIEEDGETACPRGEGDDEDAPCAEHEDVADL